MLDNIGMPASSINLSYNDSGLIGTGDADILVSLAARAPSDRRITCDRLRARLNREFPGITFYFLPADIVSQSINFGLPAPVRHPDWSGRNQAKNREVAARLADKIRQVPGAVDVRVQQPADLPKLSLAVDRTKAAEMGLTERDVANSVLLSLSGSGQVSARLLDRPARRHPIPRQHPRARASDGFAGGAQLDSHQRQPAGRGRRRNCWPTSPPSPAPPAPPVISHYNVMPVIDIFGGVSGRDLGGVLRDLKPLIAQAEKELPRGSFDHAARPGGDDALQLHRAWASGW